MLSSARFCRTDARVPISKTKLIGAALSCSQLVAKGARASKGTGLNGQKPRQGTPQWAKASKGFGAFPRCPQARSLDHWRVSLLSLGAFPLLSSDAPPWYQGARNSAISLGALPRSLSMRFRIALGRIFVCASGAVLCCP